MAVAVPGGVPVAAGTADAGAAEGEAPAVDPGVGGVPMAAGVMAGSGVGCEVGVAVG